MKLIWAFAILAILIAVGAIAGEQKCRWQTCWLPVGDRPACCFKTGYGSTEDMLKAAGERGTPQLMFYRQCVDTDLEFPPPVWQNAKCDFKGVMK